MTSALRILLGISGGIAAYKAPFLVRRLRERGHEVRCALTANAEAFVTPLTLEVLSESPVYRQEYLTATGSGQELHITAAQWAQVLCIAPATAQVLARLALGLADDFLSTTALAFEGPLLVAPAMHRAMWHKPTVQDHIDILTRRGVRVLGPVEGALASGESGLGRMVEPEDIVEAVEAIGGPGPLSGRQVLVSAGPTYEPIDPVRFLGNRSSGKMGFALAAEAARQGAQVILVSGPVSLATPPGVERRDVTTALEMQEAIYEAAPGRDLVIMVAAVSDFRPAQPVAQKIKRGGRPPSLALKTNPDILASLAEVAPHAVRVGFAAETEDLHKNATAKLREKQVHFLVANDVSRSDIGFESDANEVTVFRLAAAPVHLGRKAKRELAGELLKLFKVALAEGVGETTLKGDRP